MVRKASGLFQCEKCGFKYASRELAKKCEEFCTKHRACSLEITKHAVDAEAAKKSA